MVCALLPWAIAALNTVPNGDILWLSECMRRYLHGGTMAGDFYETNPPLALFTAAPGLFIAWVTHLSPESSIFAFTLLAVLSSAWVVWRIVRRWPFLNAPERLTFIAGYILANTVLCGSMFGERDHLLALGLVPFTLMQAAVTFRLPLDKKLEWGVFFCGAWCILLKPHHGLLATLMLIHRAVYQRRLSVVRDADFIMLAVASLLYMAFTCILFPDYVAVILPDVIKFYAAVAGLAYTKPLALEYIGAAALLLPAILFLPWGKEARWLAAGMLACGVISLIPFIVQGRGYYYHLIPALVFLWLALSLRISAFLTRQTGGGLATILGIAFMTGLTWQIAQLHRHPTIKEYRKLPLIQLIASSCGQPPCSFFMFYPGQEVIHQAAYGANAFHASRFPAFWFLPQLVHQQALLDRKSAADMTQEQIDFYYKKYASMTAADINRYKPPLILIARFRLHDAPFDFVRYFGADPDFVKSWDRYRKDGTITIPILTYLPGSLHQAGETMTFDIYRRAGPE